MHNKKREIVKYESEFTIYQYFKSYYKRYLEDKNVLFATNAANTTIAFY